MLSDQIKHLNPCSEAIQWLDSLPEGSTLQDAWNKCHRGDWMIWLWGKSIKSESWSDDRKPFLACTLDCAETVQHLFGKQTKSAIVVLRQWINGEVNQQIAEEERQNLCAAAATCAAATYIAYAATYAAAAAATTYAAAAAATYAADVRIKNQQQTAEIVRKHLPICPF